MPTSALVCRQKSGDKADVGIGPYGLLNRYLTSYFLLITYYLLLITCQKRGATAWTSKN